MTTAHHVEVAQDGLTYCIDLIVDDVQVEALLREEEGVWILAEVTKFQPHEARFSHTIGRRQHWVRALADALVFAEAIASTRGRPANS